MAITKEGFEKLLSDCENELSTENEDRLADDLRNLRNATERENDFLFTDYSSGPENKSIADRLLGIAENNPHPSNSRLLSAMQDIFTMSLADGMSRFGSGTAYTTVYKSLLKSAERFHTKKLTGPNNFPLQIFREIAKKANIEEGKDPSNLQSGGMSIFTGSKAFAEGPERQAFVSVQKMGLLLKKEGSPKLHDSLWKAYTERRKNNNKEKLPTFTVANFQKSLDKELQALEQKLATEQRPQPQPIQTAVATEGPIKLTQPTVAQQPTTATVQTAKPTTPTTVTPKQQVAAATNPPQRPNTATAQPQQPTQKQQTQAKEPLQSRKQHPSHTTKASVSEALSTAKKEAHNRVDAILKEIANYSERDVNGKKEPHWTLKNGNNTVSWNSFLNSCLTAKDSINKATDLTTVNSSRYYIEKQYNNLKNHPIQPQEQATQSPQPTAAKPQATKPQQPATITITQPKAAPTTTTTIQPTPPTKNTTSKDMLLKTTGVPSSGLSSKQIENQTPRKTLQRGQIETSAVVYGMYSKPQPMTNPLLKHPTLQPIPVAKLTITVNAADQGLLKEAIRIIMEEKKIITNEEGLSTYKGGSAIPRDIIDQIPTLIKNKFIELSQPKHLAASASSPVKPTPPPLEPTKTNAAPQKSTSEPTATPTRP